MVQVFMFNLTTFSGAIACACESHLLQKQAAIGRVEAGAIYKLHLANSQLAAQPRRVEKDVLPAGQFELNQPFTRRLFGRVGWHAHTTIVLYIKPCFRHLRHSLTTYYRKASTWG